MAIIKRVEGKIKVGITDWKKPIEGEGFLNDRMNYWHESFKWYDVQHESKFAGILFKMSLIGSIDQGIEISDDLVEIKKYGICCSMSERFPYHSSDCGECDRYKDGYFAVLKTVKEDDNQDELPTDEEIKTEAKKQADIWKFITESDHKFFEECFIEGAKWMRNQFKITKK